MNMIAGPLCQPRAYLGMLVRGVVVHNQVNIEFFGNAGVQTAQEGEKLLVPVAGLHSV